MKIRDIKKTPSAKPKAELVITPLFYHTPTENIRRFLDGVGVPAAVRGPDRIGTALSPARTDPDVTEFTTPEEGEGDNNAVWVGGTWFDPNGWLTWAYSSLDGVLPDARQRAGQTLQTPRMGRKRYI